MLQITNYAPDMANQLHTFMIYSADLELEVDRLAAL